MAAITTVTTVAKKTIETTVKEAVETAAKDATKITAEDLTKVAGKDSTGITGKDTTGIVPRGPGKEASEREVQEEVARETGKEVINNNTEGEEGASLALGAIGKGKRIGQRVENKPDIQDISKPREEEILGEFHIPFEKPKGDKLESPFPFPLEPTIHDLTTRNDGVTVHSTTGVPFVREKFVDPDTGEIKEGSFPVFDSVFDTKLPEDLYLAPDSAQFAECNKQLQDWVNKNPELAKEKFTPEQLEVIKNNPIKIQGPNGKTITVWKNPPGLTWHHNQKPGLMQLVDTKTHAATGHTGGQAIWGNRSKHTTEEK